jgi:hypothetical protein
VLHAVALLTVTRGTPFVLLAVWLKSRDRLVSWVPEKKKKKKKQHGPHMRESFVPRDPERNRQRMVNVYVYSSVSGIDNVVRDDCR